MQKVKTSYLKTLDASKFVYLGEAISGNEIYCLPEEKPYLQKFLPEVRVQVEIAGFGEYRKVVVFCGPAHIVTDSETNELYDTLRLEE